jgi:DTW domain-containing protein YfiP
MARLCYNFANCGGMMQVQVLVLNANFEPINVCNTRRAIVLILSDTSALSLKIFLYRL